MHFRDRYGPFICCALFVVIFVFLKTELIEIRTGPYGTEYGLLLYTLPGIATAYVARQSPLFCALFGAVLAIPICYTVRVLYFERVRTIVQEMAYVGSAVFWCVMGALFYLLIRTLIKQVNQH